MDVKKIMGKVKRKLRSMVCPDCHKAPTVAISGKSFNITACCPPFKTKVTAVAKKEFALQKQKALQENKKNEA